MKCVRPACLTYYTAMKLKVQTMSGNSNSSYGAVMFIEWIVNLSQMVSGSMLQQTSEVRVSHTQYPPLYALVIIGPLCIYCYCFLIGTLTNLLVFRENGY